MPKRREKKFGPDPGVLSARKRPPKIQTGSEPTTCRTIYREGTLLRQAGLGSVGMVHGPKTQTGVRVPSISQSQNTYPDRVSRGCGRSKCFNWLRSLSRGRGAASLGGDFGGIGLRFDVLRYRREADRWGPKPHLMKFRADLKGPTAAFGPRKGDAASLGEARW